MSHGATPDEPKLINYHFLDSVLSTHKISPAPIAGGHLGGRLKVGGVVVVGVVQLT